MIPRYCLLTLNAYSSDGEQKRGFPVIFKLTDKGALAENPGFFQLPSDQRDERERSLAIGGAKRYGHHWNDQWKWYAHFEKFVDHDITLTPSYEHPDNLFLVWHAE